MEKLGVTISQIPMVNQKQQVQIETGESIEQTSDKAKELQLKIPDALNNILKPTEELNYVPNQLKKRRKRKRLRL
ncbi:MAG: hypothetical protein WDO19_20240 [Bacteroidota bacterium]